MGLGAEVALGVCKAPAIIREKVELKAPRRRDKGWDMGAGALAQKNTIKIGEGKRKEKEDKEEKIKGKKTRGKKWGQREVKIE